VHTLTDLVIEDKIQSIYQEVSFKQAMSHSHLDLMKSRKATKRSTYFNYAEKPFDLKILLDNQYWIQHDAFGNSNAKYLPSPKKDIP